MLLYASTNLFYVMSGISYEHVTNLFDLILYVHSTNVSNKLDTRSMFV